MADRPNILLVVLDAVRTDHVSCYGYGQETTPNIDALAGEGTTFGNAFSPSIWTPTAHGAVFTGRYPSHAGTYTGSLSLPDDMPVLPEILAEHGYEGFATSSGLHIRSDRGYDRGLDEFVETYRIQPDREFLSKFLSDGAFRRQTVFSATRGPDDKTLYKFDRLRSWMDDRIAADEPFFGFVNCKTAHQPWNPPRPYTSMFGDRELSRPPYEFIERAMMALGRRGQRVDGIDMDRIERVQDGHPVIAGEMELSEEEWDLIRAWYDGAIRYLDRRVGQLVDHLKEQGVFEDTLLVVTSDHGDQFGDHGLSGHMFALYDTLLRVPLVVSPPGGAAGADRIDSQVTLVDLFPTFLEAAGIDGADHGYDYPLTESLFDLEDRRYHDYTFAEYARPTRTIDTVERHHPEFDAAAMGFDRSLQSVRSDEYKLIAGSDGERELYRWREDPGETEDLSAERPDVVAELEAVIDDSLGTFEEGGRGEEVTDEALREQLEHMGYL